MHKVPFRGTERNTTGKGEGEEGEEAGEEEGRTGSKGEQIKFSLPKER